MFVYKLRYSKNKNNTAGMFLSLQRNGIKNRKIEELKKEPHNEVRKRPDNEIRDCSTKYEIRGHILTGNQRSDYEIRDYTKKYEIRGHILT